MTTKIHVLNILATFELGKLQNEGKYRIIGMPKMKKKNMKKKNKCAHRKGSDI